jgi:hypothetical protein
MIEELDDIAIGRNNDMNATLENGNDTLRELRTNSLQLKMELSSVEPTIKNGTNRIMNEVLKQIPELEKFENMQREALEGIIKVEIWFPSKVT